MKRTLSLVALAFIALPAAASPQVSGDGACGVRAVDNASFVTCDGDLAPEVVGPDYGFAAAMPLSPAQAWPLRQELGSRILFVDIRSRPEILMAGVPSGIQAHVPYMQPDSGWALDPRSGDVLMAFDPAFLTRLDSHLTAAGLRHGDPVILLCRSGERSRLAAELLREHGYLQVFAVSDGFEGRLVDDDATGYARRQGGWREAGLPWTTRVDATWLAATGDATR